MKNKKRSLTTTDITMREFRSAPAKILRRAARTGTKLRVGGFVLEVDEAIPETGSSPSLYGSMAASGRVVGNLRGLLSADDHWNTDG
jgi:hypothetical protein